MKYCSSLRNHCGRVYYNEWNSGLRVLQFLPRSLVRNERHFRKSWIVGCYNIEDAKSAQFMLALTPWRLISSLQQHNISFEIRWTIGFTMSDKRPSRKVLQILTNDELLTSSIQYLAYPNAFVNSKYFLKTIKQLHNVRKINVSVVMERGVTIKQICEAFNKLSRLRSIKVKSYNWECEKGKSPSAALLFGQLRHAHIRMPSVETLDMNPTALAYKSLELKIEDLVGAGKCVQVLRRCTSLNRLKIKKLVEHVPDMIPHIPSILEFLHLYPNSSNLRRGLLPQIFLTGLSLSVSVIEWAVMAVWCPNVRLLVLYRCKIVGPVTGLPLTEMQFSIPDDFGDTVVVRHACRLALHRLTIYVPSKTDLDRELDDWITSP